MCVSVSLCWLCVGRHLRLLTSVSESPSVFLSVYVHLSVCVYLRLALSRCVYACAHPCCWWSCTTSADSRYTAGWVPRTAGSSTTENDNKQTNKVTVQEQNHEEQRGSTCGSRPNRATVILPSMFFLFSVERWILFFLHDVFFFIFPAAGQISGGTWVSKP